MDKTKVQFALAQTDQKIRNPLIVRLLKKGATLTSLYRWRDGYRLGWWRVRVQMLDGSIQHWWWTGPVERNGRWKWDGVKGKFSKPDLSTQSTTDLREKASPTPAAEATIREEIGRLESNPPKVLSLSPTMIIFVFGEPS